LIENIKIKKEGERWGGVKAVKEKFVHEKERERIE
jgi:hypothetical protein